MKDEDILSEDWMSAEEFKNEIGIDFSHPELRKLIQRKSVEERCGHYRITKKGLFELLMIIKREERKEQRKKDPNELNEEPTQ